MPQRLDTSAIPTGQETRYESFILFSFIFVSYNSKFSKFEQLFHQFARKKLQNFQNFINFAGQRNFFTYEIQNPELQYFESQLSLAGSLRCFPSAGDAGWRQLGGDAGALVHTRGRSSGRFWPCVEVRLHAGRDASDLLGQV